MHTNEARTEYTDQKNTHRGECYTETTWRYEYIIYWPQYQGCIDNSKTVKAKKTEATVKLWSSIMHKLMRNFCSNTIYPV